MAGYGFNFPVVTNDILQLTTACYSRGQVGLNILYYRCSAASPGALVDDIAINQDVAGAIAYRPGMTSQSMYYGTRWRSVTNPGFAPWFHNDNEIQGNAMGSTLPTQVCGIITKKTDLIGRANRGRMYIPFPSDIYRTFPFETPNDDYQTLLRALAGLFLFTIVSETWVAQPVIYHRVGMFPTDITSFAVQPRWATQRKRGDYGKLNPLPW